MLDMDENDDNESLANIYSPDDVNHLGGYCVCGPCNHYVYPCIFLCVWFPSIYIYRICCCGMELSGAFGGGVKSDWISVSSLSSWLLYICHVLFAIVDVVPWRQLTRGHLFEISIILWNVKSVCLLCMPRFCCIMLPLCLDEIDWMMVIDVSWLGIVKSASKMFWVCALHTIFFVRAP
jgi:hypothetical protein